MAGLVRLTGWSLDYLLWELPYAAGLELMHAEMVYHGQEVRKVERGLESRGLGVVNWRPKEKAVLPGCDDGLEEDWGELGQGNLNRGQETGVKGQALTPDACHLTPVSLDGGARVKWLR